MMWLSKTGIRSLHSSEQLGEEKLYNAVSNSLKKMTFFKTQLSSNFLFNGFNK